MPKTPSTQKQTKSVTYIKIISSLSFRPCSTSITSARIPGPFSSSPERSIRVSSSLLHVINSSGQSRSTGNCWGTTPKTSILSSRCGILFKLIFNFAILLQIILIDIYLLLLLFLGCRYQSSCSMPWVVCHCHLYPLQISSPSWWNQGGYFPTGKQKFTFVVS